MTEPQLPTWAIHFITVPFSSFITAFSPVPPLGTLGSSKETHCIQLFASGLYFGQSQTEMPFKLVFGNLSLRKQLEILGRETLLNKD